MVGFGSGGAQRGSGSKNEVDLYSPGSESMAALSLDSVCAGVLAFGR